MRNLFDLRRKLFAVTGAASGIGKACCHLLSELNGRVAAIDIDELGLKATVDGLAGSGHSAHRIDLSKAHDETSLGLGEIVAKEGRLSGLVHAAGVDCTEPLRLLKPARYRNALSVNTEAALALIREFQLASVTDVTGGSIVLISSVMATAGSPGAAAYAMTKAALQGLAKSAAMELASRRIRVNCVAPGFVDTPMYQKMAARWTPENRTAVETAHPLGIGTVDDVASAVAFLLADTGRWITGTTLTVDGGYTAQ